ncbi:MAG TPA: MFS transporter [Stellaceae bacterium]|nr:MFS transporter [Stellaceae bacterium]
MPSRTDAIPRSEPETPSPLEGEGRGGGLRHGPFAFFWWGRVATTLAFQMQAVAIGWQVYDLTGSALDLGLVGLAQFIPGFALSLLVGHIADRYDRRLILRICMGIEALATLALALASLFGGLTVGALFAAIFVIGAARASELPTLHALMPQLVPPQLIPRAAAASASSNQTAIILGPALGGLAYALGPALVYALAAAGFIAASLLISAIRIALPVPPRERPSLASLFGGVAFVRGHPALMGAISLDLFAVLLGGATALLPIYARDILLTGPWGLGLLRSAPALGALAASLALARRPLDGNVGRKLFVAVIAFGLATCVFALSTSFALSLAALAALGAADSVSVVIRFSLVQIETPDALRGRVSAVNSMFIGASNSLGEFESGATAALFGTVPATVLGGIGTIMVALLWRRFFPALFRVDRL